MKKIYIHIGPNKTGSTTIQKSLFQNEELLNQNGFYIPKTGIINNEEAKHNYLEWELRGKKKYSRNGAWNDLLGEIQLTNADKIIISNENFYRLTHEEMNRIKSYLEKYKIIIVFYARRQDKRFQSLWAQRVKNPSHKKEDKSFVEWLETYDFHYDSFDYYDLYKKWGAVFGEENVLIRVVEKGQLQGTLFEDFLAAIGAENPQMYKTSIDMNVSPGIKTLSVIKEYKRGLGKKISENALQQIITIIKEYGDTKGWNREKWNVVSKELYDRIMRNYADSNNKLALEYFHREQLFLETYEDESNDISIDKVPSDELLELNSLIIENLLLEYSA